MNHFFNGLLYHWMAQLKLTAYADDVNLYVTQSSDINIINNILSTYQSVSNAKVNWPKSCGLKMNSWDAGLYCKLCISWNTKEQSFLGAFFGGDDAIDKKNDISGRKDQFSN